MSDQSSIPPPASTFEDKAKDPVYQAAFALVSMIVFSAVGKAVNALDLISVSDRFPWMSAAAFLLLFSVGNSVLSLATSNVLRYWGRSVYCFMGLALGSGVVAWLFSSLTIGEAGSYRWIFVVVTIGYLVFLSMVNMMRRIVDFAQREEWNHPRLRRGQRRRR